MRLIKKSAKTAASLFVIESMDRNDEKFERFEGGFLRSFLKLSGKEVDYVYIRTKRELEYAVELFRNSGKRYLHFSCHGNAEVFGLTLEAIEILNFARMVAPALDKRRLFVSACEVTTVKLARLVFSKAPGCYSIIGPSGSPDIRDAALMWTTFYHKMFQINSEKMIQEDIKGVLKQTAGLFDIGMRCYCYNPKTDISRISIVPGRALSTNAFSM